MISINVPIVLGVRSNVKVHPNHIWPGYKSWRDTKSKEEAADSTRTYLESEKVPGVELFIKALEGRYDNESN